MFSEAERDELRQQLVEQARNDPAVQAAAVVGSAARRSVDRWSDIDLALGLAAGIEVAHVAGRWTGALGELAAVADTLDVWAGNVLYRVFLLHTSLQVDLSFWPEGTLAPSGGQAFELLFGDAAEPTQTAPVDPHRVAGWGWLYALHARSAIARSRNWQAVQMLDGLRGQIIALCCSRRGLEITHGRGVDQLPESALTTLADTLPASVNSAALLTAYTAAVRLFSREVEAVDPALAERLEAPLTILLATASPDSS